MKFRTQKIMALMAAVVLGVSSFGSVSAMAAESVPAESISAEDAGLETAEDGEAVSADLIEGTFKPSETTVQAQDSYEYAFLGLKFSLPQKLLDQIKNQSIAMITNEVWSDDASTVQYANFTWSEMTEEQKNAEVDKIGTGYDEWKDSLSKVGVLGMYDVESHENLDVITG